MKSIPYIISFSGAQSTGKSTLLNHLAHKNTERFAFIPEVTRLIRDTFNMPINEQGVFHTQLLILNEHLRNYYWSMTQQGEEIVIMDRCILDGLVYTKVLLERFSQQYSQRERIILHDISEKLMRDLNHVYDVIFYTDPSDVSIEDDGERSTNIEFRDLIITEFNKQIKLETLANPNNIVTLSGDIQTRLETIKSVIFDRFKIEIKI